MKRIFTILALFIVLQSAGQTVVRQISDCYNDTVPVVVLPPPDTSAVTDQDSLIGWFKADMGITLVGGKVDSWTNIADLDLPGRMGDLTALSSANRPTMGTTSTGYPAVVFDGATSVVQSITGTGNGWTIIVVHEVTSVTNFGMLVSRTADGSFYWGYHNNTTNMAVQAERVAVSPSFSMHALSSITGSGVGSYVQNGNVLKASFPVPVITISPFRVGAWYNMTDFFNGKITEILVFDKAMTTAQITDFYNRYVKPTYNLP